MTTIIHEYHVRRGAEDHPDWCDLGAGCAPGVDPGTRTHDGRLSAFYPREDDVRVSMRLHQVDELVPGTVRDLGSPSVCLRLEHKAAPAPGGGPWTFDLFLNAEDLRTLGTLCAQYAERVERPTIWCSTDMLEEVTAR